MTTSNNNSGNIPSGNGQQITFNGTNWTGISSGYITVTVPQNVQPVLIDLTPEPDIKNKKKSDGCACRKCKEFYPFAEPNQNDGTLICYACRHGY